MRCCARLHYCASISASLSQRREWLTARRLPGCILESAASVRCSLAPMRQVSLPPRLPPPTLLGLGAERRGTHGAHTWSVEKEEIHTGKKRKREGCLACLRPSPLLTTALLTSLLSPPSKRNRLPFPITTPFFHPLNASGMAQQSGMLTDRIPFEVPCFTVTLLRDYL